MPYLAELSPRDAVFDERRRLVIAVSNQFKRTTHTRYSERIEACSRMLGFGTVVDENGVLALKLRSSDFCRVRFCPMCQWRRSLMWRGRAMRAIPRILADYPKSRFLFLTLTVKNCPVSELRSTLQHINASWHRLTKRKEWSALGYVKAVEVTRSSDGAAHPHIHCLILVSESYFHNNYIRQEKWTELWKDVARLNYTPIVDIRRVKAKRGAVGDVRAASMASAACEVLKYETKATDLVTDPEWLEGVVTALHKTRAVAVGGVLRGYLKEEDPDDLINGEDTPEDEQSKSTRFYANWDERPRRYTCTD